MKILFEDGVCEDVEAEHLTGDSYRMHETPMSSSSEVRLGDVVQLAQEGEIWRFIAIAERSTLETIDFLLTQKIAEAPEFHELLHSVQELGGQFEKAFGGIVFIHAPRAVADDVRKRLALIGTP